MTEATGAMDFDALVEAVARAAVAWRDPAHPARAGAAAQSLEAPNRFTEEALAFAINQQMHALRREALYAWIGGRRARTARTVGVLHPGNVPLAGLQDLLAVVLTGHRYRGALSSKSPYLLPAFAEEVRQEGAGDVPVASAEAEALFAGAQAIIATGNDETRAWAEAQCEAHDIPPARRLLRGRRYAAAVIDGHESEDEREGLAEDVLLHEGYGCRNVALLWAPAGLSPDPYLKALAAFRGVFPVHPALPGALQMQQAFLEATDQPHAYGEDLEFLVSRGAPDVQRPGHLRWTAYDDLDEVRDWIEAHRGRLQLVVARSSLAERLPASLPLTPPGTAQRPPLDWQPDGCDTVAFLTGMDERVDD